MITAHHHRFDTNLVELRSLAARADSLVLNRAMRDVGYEINASVVVRCAAETEKLFKNVLEDVASEVRVSARTVASLPPGVRGYLVRACRKSAPRLSARTKHVAEVVSPSMPSATAEVDFGDIAGDGRTIRAHHLTLVWLLFGLPGAPFSVAEQVALNRVADYRNYVAHGDETARSINDLMTRVGLDLHQTLAAVQSVGSSFATALDNFASAL